MRKSFAPMKLYKEDKIKLNDLSIELSSIERKRVSMAETQRRILKIPTLKDVLKEDAMKKRRGYYAI